jgi:hypothetical protein
MAGDDSKSYHPLPLGRGGLRKGHSGAADEGALRLDTDMKQVARELADELRAMFVLDMTMAIPKTDTITPCCPDGGAWYFGGKLIAVFEAKKQQDAGNAIERWYKNMYRCRMLNANVSYVTFCRGEGARPNGVIGVALDVAHEGWNEYFPGGNSCWLEPQGFTKDELKSEMRRVLMERIRHYGG